MKALPTPWLTRRKLSSVNARISWFYYRRWIISSQFSVIGSLSGSVIDHFYIHELTNNGGLMVGKELVRGRVVDQKRSALDGIENIAARDGSDARDISIRRQDNCFVGRWIEERQAAAGFRSGGDFCATVRSDRHLSVVGDCYFVVITIGYLRRYRGFSSCEVDHGQS